MARRQRGFSFPIRDFRLVFTMLPRENARERRGLRGNGDLSRSVLGATARESHQGRMLNRKRSPGTYGMTRGGSEAGLFSTQA
jgi:hypothetical protein